MASETVIGKTQVTMSTNATTYHAGQDCVHIEVKAIDAYGNAQDYVFAPLDDFQAYILQPDNTIAIVALNRTWQMGDNGLTALWVLDFLPVQAFPESVYTFDIIWQNETTEISIPSLPMMIPTTPGPPSPAKLKVRHCLASLSS